MDVSLLWELSTFSKKKAGRMAQWVKVLVAKPENLAWIPGHT